MSVHWVPDIHTEHPKSDRDAENRGGGGGGVLGVDGKTETDRKVLSSTD